MKFETELWKFIEPRLEKIWEGETRNPDGTWVEKWHELIGPDFGRTVASIYHDPDTNFIIDRVGENYYAHSMQAGGKMAFYKLHELCKECGKKWKQVTGDRCLECYARVEVKEKAKKKIALKKPGRMATGKKKPKKRKG